MNNRGRAPAVQTRPRANAVSAPSGMQNVGRNAQTSPVTQKFTGAGIGRPAQMPIIHPSAPATSQLSSAESSRMNSALSMTPSQVKVYSAR